MSRWLARTSRFAFAALVVAGLTSGAGAVLAAPAPANACEYAPYRGRPGVACSVNADCTSTCKFYYGDYSIGKCMSGCCVCAY
jgi:hypothetical protein